MKEYNRDLAKRASVDFRSTGGIVGVTPFEIKQ